MRCTKCLAPLAVCACVAFVGSFVTISSDDCGEFPRPAHVTWCGLPPMDMPHDEPGQMPVRPLANVTVAVSTSSATALSSFMLPPATST